MIMLAVDGLVTSWCRARLCGYEMKAKFSVPLAHSTSTQLVQQYWPLGHLPADGLAFVFERERWWIHN